MLSAYERRLERRVRHAVHAALASAIFCGFIGYSSAQAADAPATGDQSSTPQAGPDQLQQVTVEARFVREDAQQTPIAMSVITQQDIEQRGLTQVSDVSTSLPNVVFQPAGSAYGRSITAYIRGVEQQDSSFAFSPAVGFYIDDVFIGSLLASDLSLVDVESVSVLRGPQGTLFGANSESGAVVIRSVKPMGDDSGYISAGLGSFHHEQVRGGFDIPLIDDKLFLRVSAYFEKQEGFEDVYDFVCLYPAQSGTLKAAGSTLNGCQTGTLGGTDVAGARAALRWLVADNLTVDVTGDVTDDTSETPATTLIALNPSTLAAYNAFIKPLFGGVQLDNRFLPPNIYTSYASFTDPTTGLHFDPETPLYSYGASTTVNWNVTPDLDVKSITGYRNNTGQEPFDNVPAPLTTGNNNAWLSFRQWTEELNVSGKALSNALEWTAGFFFYSSTGKYAGDIDLPGIAIAPPVLVGLRILPYEVADDDQKSVFLHGIYHITEQLGLEAGIRYTHESQTWLEHQPLIDFGPDFILPPGTLVFPDKTTVSSQSRGDPKVSLQYQWTPSFMTYASYATGFKSGGVNPYANISTSQEAPFGPETVKNYEIGAKTEWFEHHLRINADVFRMDYDGLQQTASPASGLPITENVGSARIYGTELEIEARPVAQLLLNASLGYVDYQTISCGLACQTAANPSGTPANGIAPYTPKWTANAGVQYSISLGSQGTVTPRFDYSYQDAIFTDLANTPIGRIPAYGVANFHLRWVSDSGKWSNELAITNLFAREYFVNEYASYFSLGALTGTPGAPREVLYTIRRNFGPQYNK
jgi:iron complex outermembrane receptor protein